MTAREIINKAAELQMDTSILQIIECRRDLNMISEVITSEEIINNWRDAVCHLDMIEEYQEKQIKAGVPVRII